VRQFYRTYRDSAREDRLLDAFGQRHELPGRQLAWAYRSVFPEGGQSPFNKSCNSPGGTHLDGRRRACNAYFGTRIQDPTRGRIAGIWRTFTRSSSGRSLIYMCIRRRNCKTCWRPVRPCARRCTTGSIAPGDALRTGASVPSSSRTPSCRFTRCGAGSAIRSCRSFRLSPPRSAAPPTDRPPWPS